MGGQTTRYALVLAADARRYVSITSLVLRYEWTADLEAVSMEKD